MPFLYKLQAALQAEVVAVLDVPPVDRPGPDQTLVAGKTQVLHELIRPEIAARSSKAVPHGAWFTL